MKQIRITEIYPPDPEFSHRALRNYYYIPMPQNKYAFYFKSKKKALQFAAGFSKHLNKTIQEINYFTSDLYKIYRILWPFIEGNSQIHLYFKWIDDRFGYIFKLTSIYSVYSDFLNIFNSLHQIINELGTIAVKNKQYNLKHHLNVMKKMINEIEESVMNYGSESPYRIDYDPKKLF